MRYSPSRQNQSRYMQKHKSIRIAVINRAKSRPCTDCQGWFEPWQMDFDHLPRYEKKGNISQFKHSKIEILVKEIAKCEIVCANCHRDRTYKRGHKQ